MYSSNMILFFNLGTVILLALFKVFFFNINCLFSNVHKCNAFNAWMHNHTCNKYFL